MQTTGHLYLVGLQQQRGGGQKEVSRQHLDTYRRAVTVTRIEERTVTSAVREAFRGPGGGAQTAQKVAILSPRREAPAQVGITRAGHEPVNVRLRPYVSERRSVAEAAKNVKDAKARVLLIPGVKADATSERSLNIALRLAANARRDPKNWPAIDKVIVPEELYRRRPRLAKMRNLIIPAWTATIEPETSLASFSLPRFGAWEKALPQAPAAKGRQASVEMRHAPALPQSLRSALENRSEVRERALTTKRVRRGEIPLDQLSFGTRLRKGIEQNAAQRPVEVQPRKSRKEDAERGKLTTRAQVSERRRDPRRAASEIEGRLKERRAPQRLETAGREERAQRESRPGRSREAEAAQRNPLREQAGQQAKEMQRAEALRKEQKLAEREAEARRQRAIEEIREEAARSAARQEERAENRQLRTETRREQAKLARLGGSRQDVLERSDARLPQLSEQMLQEVSAELAAMPTAAIRPARTQSTDPFAAFTTDLRRYAEGLRRWDERQAGEKNGVYATAA